MPPKYVFHHPGYDPADPAGAIGAALTLEELVELYADEFPDADDLPDLLTVDDLSELTETFDERGCVPFLKGVPAMRREESFRAQLEALPVGGTLQIEEDELRLKRTE